MASPRTELRMVAGFALVPLVAGALAFVAFLALWTLVPQRTLVAGTTLAWSGPTIDNALAAAAGAVLLAILVTVFAAVPVVSWLAGRGAVTLRASLLLGAALGNAPFVIGLIVGLLYQIAHGTVPANPSDIWYGTAGAFRVIASGCFVGAGSAAIFWLIAVRGSELTPRPS